LSKIVKLNKTEIRNRELYVLFKYKKINELIYAKEKKAEEGDHLKSSFLANMSHEIRTDERHFWGLQPSKKNQN
jgi:signal transduction histidine kinase